MFRSLIAGALLLIGAHIPLQASTGPEKSDDFRRIITDQLAAFNADDETRAFSLVTPSLQHRFSSPHSFMAMVKQGYQPVYRQKSYLFADDVSDSSGPPIQKVILVDQNGKVWNAIYAFERQMDGSWRISGCLLVELKSADA